MERLLADAEKLSGVKYDISSYADIVDAIHVVQTEMGITGTTAKEAATTIQGSVSAMKSAWANLVTGLGNDNADIDKLINNLVGSVETAAKNILPRVEKILVGIGSMFEKLSPIIAEKLPAMIQAVLPSFLSAGAQLLDGLITGITTSLPQLVEAAAPIVMTLVQSLTEQLPAIIEAGLQVIVTLANGIAESLPELIPTIVDVVLQIVETLIDNVDMLIDAAIEIILALADGLIEALPDLIDAIPTIIEKLVEALIENAPEILSAGLELSLALIEGIISIIPNLLETSKTLAKNLAEYITNPENVQKIADTATDLINGLIDGFNNVLDTLTSVGRDVVDSIKKGISDAWEGLKTWFNGIWNSLFGDRNVNVNVTKSGPSNDDNNNKPPVDDSAADGLYYVPFDGFIAELHKGERVLTASEASAYNKAESNGNTSGITIIQNIQAVPQTPVEFAAATEAYFEQARWAFA